jgi:hypothetical protein
MAWRAGYDLQAYPRFFDRITENKGATGNFFTDMFGATRPEAKRLREMIKGIEAIPASCRQPRPPDDPAAFLAWRKTVAELSREDLRFARPGLSPTLRLTPRMRPELVHFKFSPDGTLLIAQDDSGVNVLRREPLEYVFRIPAVEAGAAAFDGESKRILLPAAGPRLEIWNIEARSRELLWEPGELQHCRKISPSPDGKFAACFTGDDEVRLLEVGSNAELGRHRFTMNALALLIAMLDVDILPVHGAFSPDGATFLAATSMGFAGGESWAFDLRRREEFSVGKPLRGSIGSSFAFTGPDRLAAVHPEDIRQSGLYSWPDGKLIEKFTIPRFHMTAAAKGQVVLLRPFQEYAVGALDLQSKEIFNVSLNSAMDRYEDLGVAERGTGQVALYPNRKTQPVATLTLPEADLGRLRSAVHSPDLEWVALSLHSRAAVWNLRTGQATILKPFSAGSISADGVWTTTFDSWVKRTDGQGFKQVRERVAIDLRKPAQLSSFPLESEKGKRVRFVGKYEVAFEHFKPGQAKTTLAVKDVVANRELWTLDLEREPVWHLGDALVLDWRLDDRRAEEIVKASPELKRKRDKLTSRENASLVEVIDLETGKSLGNVLVEGGRRSISPRRVHVAGRTLFFEDENLRTLAYSLDTGERSGQQFGGILASNKARGLVSVQNEPGVIVVFDSSMRRLAEYALPGHVIYAGFDGEGKRLLAITGAQEVFIQELPE